MKTIPDLEALLYAYRSQCSRRDRLRIEAAKIERQVSRAQGEYGLRAAGSQGGKGSMPGNPTQAQAIEHVAGAERYFKELSEIMDELTPLEDSCALVEALLVALTDEERFVIRELYFNRRTLQDLSSLYEKSFPYRSINTLRRIKKAALRTMIGIW